VLAGAWLRYTGLAWGVRHPIHTDERVYVDNVVAMLQAGDLDHRFYTYPGLFFYVLALPLKLLGPEYWTGATPFVVSRAVVATFGVANIVLLYFATSRLVGPVAALVAAAMLAVSPLDIRTSHEVRPDILLEGLGIVALLLFPRQRTWKDDAACGLLIGFAAAIKFTGLLLVPMYLAHRLLGERRRDLVGMMLAGAVTVAVLVACTPYALLNAAHYAGGPGVQLRMYYGDDPMKSVDYLGNVAYYLRDAATTLGWVGTALFLLGAAVLISREPKVWLPRLVHPLTVVAVMATAVLVFPRLILPAMGVVYVIAGFGVEWVAARTRGLAALFTLACVVPAARDSYAFVRYISQTSARDKTLDWIEANVPAGARILEARWDSNVGGRAGETIGIDRVRHEVVEQNDGDRVALRLLAPEMDFVLTGPGPGAPGTWSESLVTVFRGLGPANDLVLQLKRPDPRVVPRYRTIPFVASVSTRATTAAALSDGDVATAWSTDRALMGDEWIEVTFPAPTALGRVELFLANTPRQWGPEVEISTRREPGAPFTAVRAVPTRPDISEQVPLRAQGSPRALSQAFVLNPRPVVALRIAQKGVRLEPWVLSEIRLEERY
jgi:hypothetical protein